MGSKIPKTTGIFCGVDHPKSRGVTHWAERIGLLVDHINQFSCCAAFGAIQKNHMLFFEYFKIGCMYLDNFIFYLKGMKWGYVGYHLPHCYINHRILCNEKAAKKPKKSRAELRQHYSCFKDLAPLLVYIVSTVNSG